MIERITFDINHTNLRKLNQDEKNIEKKCFIDGKMYGVIAQIMIIEYFQTFRINETILNFIGQTIENWNRPVWENICQR